ncbi:MAG: LPS assembly lipoprotein LptE [Hydrogenophaga sp.]|uniref:LPS-assembly lipoprotein LptE n=1 Tax=Hydrogenophaga sp. TaxID=1904254 RepID=UPI002614FB66|nr:LPS assembly lipoprotein LptE [Hydrogenophaga sp.]MDM7942061.1 LPS assembly lipoprotein LptE [Hydrogenophaga sp.]
MTNPRHEHPRRRTWLQLTLAATALGLSGCGFALRQAPTFAFGTLRLQGMEGTQVSRELREALQANGVRVLTSATPATGPGAQVAQAVLTVLVDQRERVVVGQTAAGQVRELQLRTRFVFRLRTPADKILIDDTELLLERDISFNETQVLAKDAEEAMLFRDMRGDVVQQVIRRLAAVKSL